MKSGSENEILPSTMEDSSEETQSSSLDSTSGSSSSSSSADGTNSSIASTQGASWSSSSSEENNEEEDDEAALPRMKIPKLDMDEEAPPAPGSAPEPTTMKAIPGMADPKQKSRDEKLPSDIRKEFDLLFKSLIPMERDEPMMDVAEGGFANATMEASPIKGKEMAGAEPPLLPSLVQELPKAGKSDFVMNWVQKLDAGAASSSPSSVGTSSSPLSPSAVSCGSASELQDALLRTSPASAAVSPSSSSLTPSTDAMLANDIAVVSLDNNKKSPAPGSSSSTTKSPGPGSPWKLAAAQLTRLQKKKRLNFDSADVTEIVRIEDEIGKLEAIRDVEMALRKEKKVAEWKKKRMEKAAEKGADVQAQGEWRKRLRKRGADEMC